MAAFLSHLRRWTFVQPVTSTAVAHQAGHSNRGLVVVFGYLYSLVKVDSGVLFYLV